MPIQPDASRPTPVALPYSQLPPAYHRWKWQVLHGLEPYKRLLSNPQFMLASQVKGLENVVRYGLTTWMRLSYFEAAGRVLCGVLISFVKA